MYTSDYLCHYGIKGMRWYVRRYQNKDGSLTPEGRVHYGIREKQLKNKRLSYNNRFKDWGNSKSTNVLYLEDKNAVRGDTSSTSLFISEAKKQGNVSAINLTKYKSFSWTLERTGLEKTRDDVINRMVKDGTFDKEFLDILDKRAPGWSSLHDSHMMKNSEVLLANGVTTRGEVLSKIGDAITEYGAKKFSQGSKVVVTGSELFSLHDNDPDFYKNNPVCFIGDKKGEGYTYSSRVSELNEDTAGVISSDTFKKYFEKKVKDI